MVNPPPPHPGGGAHSTSTSPTPAPASITMAMSLRTSLARVAAQPSRLGRRSVVSVHASGQINPNIKKDVEKASERPFGTRRACLNAHGFVGGRKGGFLGALQAIPAGTRGGLGSKARHSLNVRCSWPRRCTATRPQAPKPSRRHCEAHSLLAAAPGPLRKTRGRLRLHARARRLWTPSRSMKLRARRCGPGPRRASRALSPTAPSAAAGRLARAGLPPAAPNAPGPQQAARVHTAFLCHTVPAAQGVFCRCWRSAKFPYCDGKVGARNAQRTPVFCHRATALHLPLDCRAAQQIRV